MISSTQPRRDIVKGYARLAKRARIVRCVHPPRDLHKQHEEILKHSVDEGVVHSLYTITGDEREEFGKKEAAIGHTFLKLFNGDWSSRQWQHFCVKGENDRRPCCSTIAESRTKLLNAMSAMHNICVFDKLSEGTIKWAETPRRCSKTSVLVHCHDSFPQAAAAWLKRKSGDAADTSSDEHAGDEFSLRTRKRKRKACKFWSTPFVASMLTGVAISTKPIRVLLSKCFAAEKEARVRSSLRSPIQKQTIITEFASAGGHFDDAVGELEALLSDASPLLKLCSTADRDVTRNRGMVLRARGSVHWRLMRFVKRRTGYFQTVCVVDSNNDMDRQAFWSHLSTVGKCCLDVFGTRLKRRLQHGFDNHEISCVDQLIPDSTLGKAIRWSASTPPLLMISSRETDHANLSNKLKAKKWWKQGLLPLVQDQLLERHRTLLPKRVWLRDRRGGKSRFARKRRLNQHSAKPSHMIGDISRIVQNSLVNVKKSHERPSHPGGIYHLWRKQQLAVAKTARPGKWTKTEIDDFDDDARKRWIILPPDQKRAADIRSAVTAPSSRSDPSSASSSFAIASPWPIATIDSPCSSFGLARHMDAVDTDRTSSLPQAGLRPMEEMSRAYTFAKHGPRAPNLLAHAKLGPNDALNQDLDAFKRCAKRDCDTLHFGVCRSDPLLKRPLFSKMQRVAKSLYNGCSGSMGQKLYMIIGIGQKLCSGGELARFFLAMLVVVEAKSYALYLCGCQC